MGETTTCATCGEVLPLPATVRPGRPARYCGVRCRRRREARCRVAGRLRALAARHRARGDDGRAAELDALAGRQMAGTATAGEPMDAAAMHPFEVTAFRP